MFLDIYSLVSISINISSYIVASMKEVKIQLTGFEVIEKPVAKSGNSGRVYVPAEWIGKKVKVILIEK